MARAYEVYADSRQITREEWLEHRKSGIGGSDAGAIMGVSPYKGAYSVWADKMGFESSFEDSEATRQGRDLEEYAAKRFAEKTGKSVRHEYGMLRSRECPFMVANFDRRIIGQQAGLECKWSKDIYKKRWREGDMPMEYYCQCLHYMKVSGWDVWYLVVVIALTDVITYKISRGPKEEENGIDWYLPDVADDIDALVVAEETFWRDHVEHCQAPAPDGLRATSEALGTVYSRSEDYAIESTDEDDMLIEQLVSYRQQKKAAEAAIRKLENQIKARMETAEELHSPIALVSWKSQKQRRISEKKLKELYPEIDVNAIRETVETRRFTVREEEAEE